MAALDSLGVDFNPISIPTCIPIPPILHRRIAGVASVSRVELPLLNVEFRLSVENESELSAR